MPKNGFEHKPGMIDGHDWSFYFDCDEGAKATVDGEVVGKIDAAHLRQLLKLDRDMRDADLEADEIVRALERASHLPGGLKHFPWREQLAAALSGWISSG